MIVDCAVYEGGKRRDGKVDLEHAYRACHSKEGFAWIGLVEPTDEEFESLAREFELHPLAVEDAINAHQRPKIEVFDDVILLVLKTARYVDPTEIIELGEILVFLGEDFVITVRHGEASDLHGVRERLEGNPDDAEVGSRCGRARDRGQGGGRLSAGARRSRGGHRGAGERGLLARAARPHRAHLPPQARGARVLPCRRAAGRARGPAGPRALRDHPARGAHLLPRRERPPASRPRAARELPRPAHERARGQPDPDHRAPERGRAQDLRRSGASWPCPR